MPASSYVSLMARSRTARSVSERRWPGSAKSTSSRPSTCWMWSSRADPSPVAADGGRSKGLIRWGEEGATRRNCPPMASQSGRYSCLRSMTNDVCVVGEQQVAPCEDLGEEGLASAGRSENPDVGVLTDTVVEQVQLHQAVRLLVDPEHDAARHARRCRHERVDGRKRAGVQSVQNFESVPRFR